MEQNELDNLQQLADTTDTANGAALVDENGAALPPAPPPIDYGSEAAGMVDTFVALLDGFSPRAALLWNPATKARVTAGLAPVMEKYGVSMGGLPCEIVLVILAGPVLFQTARLVGAEINAASDEKKAQAPALVRQAAPAAPASGQDRTAGPMTAADIGGQAAPDVLRSPQTALYAA